MTKEGRLLILAELPEAPASRQEELLDIDAVVGEIRISSRLAGIRRAQDLLARHLRPGASMAEELIRERGEDAARE